jgi:hypothetical protein
VHEGGGNCVITSIIISHNKSLKIVVRLPEPFFTRDTHCRWTHNSAYLALLLKRNGVNVMYLG